MQSAADMLAEGLDHHRAGRLAEADASYRHVLASDPQQPSALYLRGTLLLAQDADAAEPLLARAACLRPDHADSHLALANARHRRGDSDGAAQLWRRVLDIEPGHVAACLNLAGWLRARDAWREAADLCCRALHLQPEHAGLWLGLAAALLAGHCHDEAGNAADSAVTLDPTLAEAWLIRGTAHGRRHAFDGALADLRHALQLDPASARAALHLGNTLLDMDRLEEAEAALRHAITLDPALPEAHSSLGFLHSSRRNLEQAVVCHDRALALRPDLAEAHSNRAAALLLAGDYQRGLDEYEWRKHNPLFAACYWQSERPEWHGEPLGGRTLLVFCEQGFGDSIMCARYLPQLAASGSNMVLVCAAPLIPLLAQIPGIAALVPRGDPLSGQRLAEGAVLPPYDTWIDQMSLPRVLQTRIGAIPARSGYLQADPCRIAAWQARLGQARLPPGRRIGLAWSGNPRHSNDHRRSITLTAAAPLLAVTGLAFIALQPAADGLHDIWPHLTDYAETAAAIACLDLVICVDTSVAHLAGAMGKPVWLMLPYAAEWRWLAAGQDSPWYASMRLFRQRVPGAWTALIDHVAAELEAWRDSSSTQPC